jgi:hypothetical protein
LRLDKRKSLHPGYSWVCRFGKKVTKKVRKIGGSY